MPDTILIPPEIKIAGGLRPADRSHAAQGYWNAFQRKLRYPLGPQDKAVAFIERVLDPSHAISARSADGAFLGVAGFKSSEGAFVGGDFADLAAVYGNLGAVLRALAIGILERSVQPEILLMDGIFVAPAARGRGVGTALLRAVERHAAANGLSQIRLDVIDTNPRARALYERQGFSKVSETSLGPLAPIFGFSRAAEMRKRVGA